MKKKIFNVFLTILTVITQINLPVNVLAEDETGVDGDDSGISVSIDENQTNEENTFDEANQNEEGETVTSEDPFTFDISYDDEFSKATITISYGKDDASYLDLDNGEEFQELADQGVIAVNDEKTSDLSLAFDVTANGDYKMSVSAYDDNDEIVANSEKTVQVSDIKDIEEVTPTVDDTKVEAAKETIAEASIDDVRGYIDSGKTFAFFVGNKADDELWQRVLVAYSNIQTNFSGEYDTTFLELQGDGDFSKIANVTNDADDISALTAAYEDLANGSTGHGAIGFVYNNEVVYVVKEHDDTDNYTVEQQAVINWLSKYTQESNKTTASNSEDNIMLASIVGSDYKIDLRNANVGSFKNYVIDNDGNVIGWEYAAKGNYQSFTAPESGVYYITLWGADGDSDSGSIVDSFLGEYGSAKYIGDDGQLHSFTSGVGGESGTVTGYVHLEKGQTIYLSLGYMNGMNSTRKYGGGGTGDGVAAGYLAGGGGLGAIYTELKGNGELTNYSEGDSSILMVAGGGGGAEDFYTASWDYNDYYCSYNECSNVYGGNGGKNPTTGYIPSQNNAVGATAESGAYAFGLGQSYASSSNASSGGGGAGYYGGKSAATPVGGSGQYGTAKGHTVELNRALRGGTGAGGSSYINEDVVVDGTYIDGDNSIYGTNGYSIWPKGNHAGATIEVASYDQHTLTINYYDVNSSKYNDCHKIGTDDSPNLVKVAESVTKTLVTGDNYSVVSPAVDGFTLVDDDDNLVEGVMPDEDIVINVYYDYPQLTINYYEWDSVNGVGTTTKLADSHIERMKKGTSYSVNSANINGYVFYYENSATIEADGVTNNDGHFSSVVSGTMSGSNQTYNVYYVKEFTPVKHIIYLNGVQISETECEAGLALKVGDIVTYQISYQNNQYESVTKEIIDELPSGLKYNSGASNDSTHELVESSDSKLAWNVIINGASSKEGKAVNGYVTFKAEVVDSANKDEDIQNWGRPDRLISYSVVKTSDPVSESIVTTNDFITYTLKVKNTGEHAVENIVVVDEIPTYTEFVEIDNDSAVNFNGVSRDGYVKFVIDELKAGATVNLKFKVRVIGEGTATNIADANAEKIINFARYQNYQVKQDKEDNSKDENILNNGIKTNEVVHYLLGAHIIATKESTPVSGSVVNTGDTITYKITLTNDGETRANYVRVTDDIPVGTTFVNGSLKLTGDTGSFDQPEVWSRFNYTKSFSTITDSHTEKLTESYFKNVGNIGAERCNTSGWHTHQMSFSVPSNVNVTRIAIQYYNQSHSGNSATLQGSSNGSSWTTIATGDHHSGAGGQLWCDINTSYRYLRVVHEGSYSNDNYINWSSVAYVNVYGTIDNGTKTVIDGYHLANANVNVSGGTIKNVVVTSSNTNWDISGINTSVWSVSTNSGILTLTPKTTGSVGNVTNAQINTALNAIKWTGETAPNVTITINGSDVMTGYADSSNSCKYVTTNGTPYIECIGVDVDKDDQMEVSFDVTVNESLASTFEIKNVAKYETYQSEGPIEAGESTTKPTNETNETVHYLQSQTLSIVASKSSNPASGSAVKKGQNIVYSLTFTNNGNTTIKYLQVRDAIPDYTSFRSASDSGVYSQNGDYVEWVLTNLKVGESKTVTFTVRVNDSITTSDEIRNIAYYEIYQENPGDAGTITTAPTKPTNETIHTINGDPANPDKPSTTATKSSNPISGSTVHRQDEIEYAITLTNTGKGTQDFTLVEDKIPEGTTFKEITAYTGGSSSSDLEVRSYYNSTENSVKYVVANLAPNDSISLHFVVKVNKEIQLNEIHNTAKYLPLSTSVTSPVMQRSEINLRNLNDSSTVDFQTLDVVVGSAPSSTNETVHYLYQPNVTVTKDSNPESNTVVARGSQITYTLTVTNTGDDVANYVNVADIIPANTTYVNNSAKTSVDTDASGVKKTNGSVSEVQYVLYDLQPNETRTVSFTVEVNKNTQSGAFITNVAVYDNFEVDHGKPGKDDFVEPSKPTNETIHTVEMSSDIILTGGEGWNTYLPYIGGGLIAVALIVIVIASKKKKTK